MISIFLGIGLILGALVIRLLYVRNKHNFFLEDDHYSSKLILGLLIVAIFSMSAFVIYMLFLFDIC